jgi:hypothetical protein
MGFYEFKARVPEMKREEKGKGPNLSPDIKRGNVAAYHAGDILHERPGILSIVGNRAGMYFIPLAFQGPVLAGECVGRSTLPRLQRTERDVSISTRLITYIDYRREGVRFPVSPNCVTFSNRAFLSSSETWVNP